MLKSLQIFKDATLFFSRETPNLAKVIPAMDHIDKHLATAATRGQYRPAIQAALTVGKKLLNKYYAATDHSEMYRIAMSNLFPISFLYMQANKQHIVLHPSHKLEYFKSAGWSEEWRETAVEIVRNEFERSYAHYQVENDDENIPVCRTFPLWAWPF